MIDLSMLNDRQRDAVTHGDGPMLVLAGAGSGKTRVITNRVAHLIESGRAQPSEILAVTFTNKAAGEMQHRVSELVGRNAGPRPSVATFHSLSLRVLRQHADRLGYTKSFAVYDTADQLALIKRVERDLEYDEKAFPPRRLRSAISKAKNLLMTPAEYEKHHTDFYGARVARAFHAYQKSLADLDGMDFDDLIGNHVRLLREHEDVRDELRERWKYLLIDEYQDTNKAQYVLIRELAGERANVTAVGDEDQSIYRFRGAELENILNFEQDFPGAAVIKLEQNYRSTGNILAAASGVVANNLKRKGKTLFTDQEDGEPVRIVALDRDRDEADFVLERIQAQRSSTPLNEMAVLFRTNAQSRSFEEELRGANIPYVVVGGTKFYERAEIKDILGFAKVATRPRDSQSIERVINVPARGIGSTTVERLRALAAASDKTLWEVIDGDLETLSERARKAVGEFRGIIHALQEKIDSTVPEFFETLIEATGYRKLYVNSKDPQDDARVENIDELLNSVGEYQEQNPEATIRQYLDEIALISDVDQWDDKQGTVTLMTLHAAKGLEFDTVFLTGMEDGVLPHSQSSEEIEEERRLCYVGMTRARKRLYCTHSRLRRVHGTMRDQTVSTFVLEIPERAAEKLDRTGTMVSPPRRDWATRPVSRTSAGRGAKTASSIGGFFNKPVKFDASALKQGQSSGGADGDKLDRGVRVRHATFGDGVILKREGTGENARLTVYFDRGGGSKKFVARFAKLTRL